MMNVGMPFGAFLAAILVLIPLPGHWRARNIPTLSIIVWLFLVNVAHGVNTIAWANNIDNKLVIWCDIVTRLDVGANLALPAACFCLCMHLERIASVRQVNTSFADKRRRMIIDLIICFGLPLIYIALYYIVQGHRFDIIENFGCHSEDYVSIPEFFLVWFPPLLFALGTFILAGLAFMHFFRRRANFALHLASTTSRSLTPGRYFRLMAMSLVEMIWTVLLVGLNLSFNYAHGLRPWTSWDDVHSNWLNINRFPIILIPQKTLRWTYFLWWSTPITAYVFVVFFAFSRETLKDYSNAFVWVKNKLGGLRRDKKHDIDSIHWSMHTHLPIQTPPKTPNSIKAFPETKETKVALWSPSTAYSADSSLTESESSSAPPYTPYTSTTLMAPTPHDDEKDKKGRSFVDSVLSYYGHYSTTNSPTTSSHSHYSQHSHARSEDSAPPDVPEDITPPTHGPSPLSGDGDATRPPASTYLLSPSMFGDASDTSSVFVETGRPESVSESILTSPPLARLNDDGRRRGIEVDMDMMSQHDTVDTHTQNLSHTHDMV